MLSNVNDLSGASSLTGTLTGIVEPTLTSAALKSDVAKWCAVLVAPASKEAILSVRSAAGGWTGTVLDGVGYLRACSW